MRKAISIIELIFTILIIALVFSVVPKMIFALKKSDEFAIRQDAILNTVSFVQMLSKLPWDEKNTKSGNILHVNTVNFVCDENSTLRVGGFLGSRKCDENLSSSVSLGADGVENSEVGFDDFDDYNGYLFGTNIYEINASISYNTEFTVSGNDVLNIDLSTFGTAPNRTNFKSLHVKTSYSGNRGEKRELLDFSYISSNLGQTTLNKRVWQ